MRRSLVFIFLSVWILSCSDTGSAPFNATNNPVAVPATPKYLYVVSGACYAGGVAVSAGPSNTVAKFDLTTGQIHSVVIDYNQLSPGDQPVAISDFDEDEVLVLVENTGGRRLDLVKRDGSGFTTYLVNTTALNAVTRDIELLTDYSVLTSKSSAVEKFNAGKSRVLVGVNPFINAPGGTCATATTLISSISAASNGLIVFAHAAATPNNRIGVIASTGYNIAADCKGGIAGPTTTALPTRTLIHSNGKVLVAYGSTTTASNFIYSYDLNLTTGALTGATAVFNDGGLVVNGPSAMAENRDTGEVFVANANSAYNTIEKFTFSANAFTRAAGPAFIPYSVYTRCPADLMVGY